MKKISLLVLTAFVIALVANIASIQAGPASADAEVHRVGLVIAYTPGQSITIQGKDGAQFTFELTQQLKIVPADRANMLGVGAYVTIVAPNNTPNGKHIAVQIVIHPTVPAGFINPTATAIPTDVPTNTETPTEVVSPTETPAAVETATEPATGTETATAETATPALTTSTTSQTNTHSKVLALVDWLAAILRQAIASLN